MDGFVVERGSASESLSTEYEQFRARTERRTPINLAARTLVVELLNRRYEGQQLQNKSAYLAGSSILNLVDAGRLPRFSTMNMRVLSAVMFYVRLNKGVVSTTNWNTPALNAIAESLILKKNEPKKENMVTGIKYDMLRYARKLYLAENPTKTYNDSLAVTSFTLYSI